jgi:hypothetical protein
MKPQTRHTKSADVRFSPVPLAQNIPRPIGNPVLISTKFMTFHFLALAPITAKIPKVINANTPNTKANSSYRSKIFVISN